MKKVTIYTDGACEGNPGPGGWAAILEYNGAIKELSGGVIATTNNRMEIQAAIEGLQRLKEGCEVALVHGFGIPSRGDHEMDQNVEGKKDGKERSRMRICGRRSTRQQSGTGSIWHWVMRPAAGNSAQRAMRRARLRGSEEVYEDPFAPGARCGSRRVSHADEENAASSRDCPGRSAHAALRSVPLRRMLSSAFVDGFKF